MSTKLIVGLGNPGTDYENTRHNVGFMVIDKLIDTLGLTLDQSRWEGVFVKTKIGDSEVIIAKPMTYMNLSGNFVRQICDFYKIWPQHMLIIHDEFSFPTGVIKLRAKGSGGGQNGMQNIINRMGTEKIKRIRVGIGSNYISDKIKFVLGRFKNDETVLIETSIANATLACNDFINGVDFDKIMNTFNTPHETKH